MSTTVLRSVASTSVSEETTNARAHFGTDYYGRPRFRRLLEHFPAGGTILDFGCNEGVFLHFLRENGRDGLGVDSDRENIAACRRFGLDAIHADVFQFLERSEHQGECAGILMADFIEHFDPRPLQDLLARSIALLRPGGALAILTPNSRSLALATGGFHENEIEHHHPYSLSGLRRFLERLGMELVAAGACPESRLRVFTPHPLRFARNVAHSVLGRLLCGKDASYREVHLVMRRKR